MEDQNHVGDTNADPLGKKMYEEVLRKNLFDPDPFSLLIGVREFTVNHLFAKVWSRSRETTGEHPPLSLRERRLVTIALLAAQGRGDQLRERSMSRWDRERVVNRVDDPCSALRRMGSGGQRTKRGPGRLQKGGL